MTIYGAIQTGLKIAKIFQKGSERFNPGLRAIDRFAPPHLRTPAKRLYRYGEAGIVPISILVNYLKSEAEDTPGNGIQTPWIKSPTRKPYKTRFRQSTGYNRRNTTKYSDRKYCRRPSYHKQFRSRNRFNN